MKSLHHSPSQPAAFFRVASAVGVSGRIVVSGPAGRPRKLASRKT
jgi:hypothetical protein